MRRFAVVCLVAVIGAWGAARLSADDEGGMFPFVIPWDDSTPGTVTDVSELNARPAGSHGFIVVKNGAFVEEQTGHRVRFLGTNVTAGSAFPTKADADKIAARMAKLGINLVRFHHLQNDWDTSIWKEGRTFVEIDPARVNQIDYFVAALKREGIYSNLNLTTTREYLPELGFPASVRDIPTGFDKKVDRWDRRMIELQKEYAAALLSHVNPYTGLAYKDEPALAFVEINNENSMVGWPGEAPGQGLAQMPEPFRGELVALWNAFLAKRYHSDADLVAAWSEGAGEQGPELIGSGVPLTFENQVAPSAAVSSVLGSEADAPGSAGARVVVRETGADWTVQLYVSHLTLASGRRYTLRFRARALDARPLNFKLHLDRPDWQNHGLQSTVSLGPEWHEFAISFQAANTEPGHSRMAFLLGDHAGTVEIAGVRLREGALPFALPPGQSLARHTVPLADGGATGRRLVDWVDFLVHTERAYTEEMRTYLRRDLGLRANMIDTQVPWGGLTSFVREAPMEYADNHAYWQHPNFPGGDWDEVRWTIEQRALTNEMDRDQGTLAQLAAWRVAGKPYSVSEYNHPAPNDYQSEMLPLLATVAAIQDWDAIYTFDYPKTGSDRLNDAVAGFFDCALNPAKVAFYPSAALILRRGLIPVAGSGQTLVLPRIPWSAGLEAPTVWHATGGVPDVLSTRLDVKVGEGDRATRQQAAGAESGVARVERLPQGAIVSADAPAAKVIVGFVGGQSLAMSGMTASFPIFGRDNKGFAALTLVAHDDASVQTAQRALLTAIGRAENRGMGWSADRTTVGDRWGEGPVQAEGIPARVSIERSRPSRVFALDERGRRKGEIQSTTRDGRLEFEIGPDQRTVWYEVAADTGGADSQGIARSAQQARFTE